MTPNIKDNLKRIAQSIARAEEKNNVQNKHLKRARGIILDSLYEVLSHESIKKEKEIMKKRKETSRYAIIQTELISNPYSTTAEIWESIKHTGEFKDIYDLQQFLDWLHKKGIVIVTRDRKYLWVGK